jgi:hypothetical protein
MESWLLLIGYVAMTAANLYVTWDNRKTYANNCDNAREENKKLKERISTLEVINNAERQFFNRVAKDKAVVVGFITTSAGTALITQEDVEILNKARQ